MRKESMTLFGSVTSNIVINSIRKYGPVSIRGMILRNGALTAGHLTWLVKILALRGLITPKMDEGPFIDPLGVVFQLNVHAPCTRA